MAVIVMQHNIFTMAKSEILLLFYKQFYNKQENNIFSKWHFRNQVLFAPLAETGHKEATLPL